MKSVNAVKTLLFFGAVYCLHFGWYNFCRIHQSLRIAPAMAAGITDHVRELGELLNAK